MKIRNAQEWERMARERNERLKPAMKLLAEEASRWIGTVGPHGPLDRLGFIKSVSDYGTFKITVQFRYKH